MSLFEEQSRKQKSFEFGGTKTFYQRIEQNTCQCVLGFRKEIPKVIKGKDNRETIEVSRTNYKDQTRHCYLFKFYLADINVWVDNAIGGSYWRIQWKKMFKIPRPGFRMQI